MKSLFALLIGIDTYPPGVNALRGCINDTLAFHNFLERQCNQDQFKFQSKLLLNEQATYRGIIDAFDHFKDATPEDICVFYFSGHGSRIKTTDFWEALDGKNESIVCWDSRLNKLPNDMIDKELSCLIYEATQNKPGMHFLAVMDCCHAGTNTRDDQNGVAGIRQQEASAGTRTISQYYGFDKGLYIKNKDGLYQAPKGNHIQFGACRNYQIAKEIWVGDKIRGAFTLSLIEALDTAFSKINYVDLEQRVSQKINNRVGNQLPQLDAVGIDANSTFLGGAISPKNRYFVAWNGKNNQWELNAGLYHGISNGKTPTIVTSKDGNLSFEIKTIEPDTSFGNWSDSTLEIDKKLQYDVAVQQAGGASLLIALVDCDPAGKATLEASLSKANTSYITLTDQIENAAYLVYAQNNTYRLIQAGGSKPVFLPLASNFNDQQEAANFWENVDRVLRWGHLKNLENPTTSIPEKDIEIKVYRGESRKPWWETTVDQMERIEDWSVPPAFKWKPDENGEMVPSSFSMQIINHGPKTLFVSAIFMGGRFGITNEYLTTSKLETGQDVWLQLNNKDENGKIVSSTTSIGLGINEPHWKAGMTEQVDFVKIVASTEDFDTGGFNQESLQILEFKKDVTRDGLSMRQGIQKTDWTTRIYPLHVIQPQNSVPLTEGNVANLMDKINISAPAGFDATVYLSNTEEASRDMDEMPPAINIEGIMILELTQGTTRSTGLSVISLNVMSGMETISDKTPLKISLLDDQMLRNDEVVMPFIYDFETKAWYPVGLPGDALHPVQVTSLPIDGTEPENTTGERNLRKALKLFLYKITVGKPIVGLIAKIIGKQDLFTLAAVKVNAEDQPNETTTNLGEIKEKIKNAKRILLFIHGFIGNTKENIRFVHRLSQQNGNETRLLSDNYDVVLTFDYESIATPIPEIVENLIRELKEVGITEENSGIKTFHVVAHSMGGLVARWWLEKAGGNKIVHQFVQVGSPNAGSKLTNAYDFALLGLTKAINFVPMPAVIQDITGWLVRYVGLDKLDDNIVQLRENSPLIKEFEQLPDPKIPYTLICGDTGMMNPIMQEKQLPIIRRLFKRLRYEAADRLIFKEPNDFVAAVSSVKHLPAGREQVVIHPPVGCDHFGFFRESAGLRILGEVMWKIQPVD